MAQLAIKGHATRGREVIELLEILGGKNYSNHSGIRNALYFIHNDTGEILVDFNCYDYSYSVFTLEKFLEKFPYKVGDKVYYNNKICNIIEMIWNRNLNIVSYGVYDGKIKNLATVEELRPYKEETMEGKVESFEILEGYCADEVKIEFDPSKFTIVKRDNGYYVVRKKPQYPKIYEECCMILQNACMTHKGGYKGDLIQLFQKLIICRNAYWKIAGEEMGLGKPWEPDWKSSDLKYGIKTIEDEVSESIECTINCFLAFPTEKMRDIFYENFKNEIEQCKELL